MSDDAPHATTTPAVTTYPVTTTPTTTTTTTTTTSQAPTTTTTTSDDVLECGCEASEVAENHATNADGSPGSAVCTAVGKPKGKKSLWTLYCGLDQDTAPTRMATDVKMAGSCSLKESLNCGAPPPTPQCSV